MLASTLFIAFWVLLGFSVFLIAIRGGLGGVRAIFQRQTLTARKVTGVTLAVVYLGFGAVLPAGLLLGNHDNASGQVGGLKLTAAEKQGRELFGQHCAICHTLAAANAIGKVGPNLDTIKPTQTLILHTIENGCLQAPPSATAQTNCLGEGTMPADVVQGRQAREVAAFVARVAGKE